MTSTTLPLLYVYVYFTTAIVQAKNLTIIRIEDNQESLILSPSVTVRLGRGVTLQCHVTDSRQRELDDTILWGKMLENYKYELSTTWDGMLNFTYIAETDEGEYFCISLENELIRVVHLVVEPLFSPVDIGRNRYHWKRSTRKRRGTDASYGQDISL